MPGSGPDGGTEPGPGTGAAPFVDVLVGGVGPAAAAAAASKALSAASGSAPYDLVVSAGIGGGFAERAPVGSLVVADAVVAADLGADSPGGFLPVDELGFGRTVHLPPAALAARAAGLAGAVHAPVLTVSTVTGTAARAAELRARHPRAAAEAMEGFGVAEAAALHGVPVLEIRAVSNPVGPRDRAAWRIGDALTALSTAFRLLGPLLAAEADPPPAPRRETGPAPLAEESSP
ncbi:futalosine hydrolase [Streptomyces sp. CAU 1734]|uniref:futalosine hydrolase n=1 Tax=Streptomyces sp. CAU 1734 TaxID=3140360 RepID=UPI00325FEF10